MALWFFAGAQVLVQRGGLGGRGCSQLLIEHLYQLVVVPERLAPFTKRLLAALQGLELGAACRASDTLG